MKRTPLDVGGFCYDQEDYVKLLPLTPKLEQSHHEVYMVLEELLVDKVPPKTKVWEDHNLKDCSARIITVKNKTHIGVRPAVVALNPFYHRFRQFAKQNTGQRSNPVHFFKGVLTHEYAHIVYRWLFDNDFFAQLRKTEEAELYCRDDGMGGIVPNSCEEAFAFWFGDTFSGFNMPVELMANGYSISHNSQAIVDIYHKLQKEKGTRGIASVLDDMVATLLRIVPTAPFTKWDYTYDGPK
ncbi:hypothetical protein HYV81_05015 [Candidatus Woesearchaeota archaeon]|nr:hypothetical protein [Candidatus Woesearchaeota archaeon]